MIYTMKLIFQSQSPTNILQLVFLGLNLNNNLYCQAQHQLQLSRPGQDSVLVLGFDPTSRTTIFSKGYCRYLALCLTLLVSQLVRFCFLASRTA